MSVERVFVEYFAVPYVIICLLVLFRLVKHKLGSGSFGEIYMGVNIHTQEKVAIKLVRSFAHTSPCGLPFINSFLVCKWWCVYIMCIGTH